MDSLQGILNDQKIAYFSMEIGLRNEIPTYAGELGVLAGDAIRSAADLNVPLVAVTLVSNKGYFRQILDPSGNQVENTEEWNPARFMTLLAEEVSVKIQNRDVKIRAWLYNVKSLTGGYVPIIFLDTDVEGNEWEDRRITDFLYGGDQRYRLKQEIVLGIGGVRMLYALGFTVRKYHMNEGHSSLLALELLRRNGMDSTKVKEQCIFTTHNTLGEGHDKFDYGLVEDLIRDKNSVDVLRRCGGVDRFNTSLFALNLSNYVNGVTKRHSMISSEIFPGYKIQAITNGVHSYTWTSPYFRELYDRYLPGWANEPELLVRVDGIPDTEISEAHRRAKKALIDEINVRTGADLDYEILTIGFARRMTVYKRATFILSELDMLRKINRRGKIQLIFAGKAHPRDNAGKQIIRDIFRTIETLKDEIKIVFLENYDMDLAAKMVAGVDVWLNTPTRPYEASGTSGMKAAHNGVINFSVLDGWWIEGWIEGVTGWAIGPLPDERLSEEEARLAELNDLYNKLFYIIVPMYYDQKFKWLRLMSNSIGMIAYYFNSHRMMRCYVTHAYFEVRILPTEVQYPYKFDIALSFASENRDIVEKIASNLRDKGINVFYDKFEKHNLWGKKLSQHFQKIYGKHSRYVVPFISKEYSIKDWTDFEFTIACGELKNRNKEFILPVRIDDTPIVGLPRDVAYLDYNKEGVDGIVETILLKLNSSIDDNK